MAYGEFKFDTYFVKLARPTHFDPEKPLIGLKFWNAIWIPYIGR